MRRGMLRRVGSVGVAVLATHCGASRQVLGEAAAEGLVSPLHRAAFGRIVRLRGQHLDVVGELLACEEEGVFLRVYSDRMRWLRLAHGDWSSVELYGSSHYLGAMSWTLVGLLSSISHGMWALVSAPVWALTGGISTGAAGPTRYDQPLCSSELRAQARWPQGVPQALRARFVHLRSDGTLEEAPTMGVAAPWSSPSATASPSPMSSPTVSGPSPATP